MRNSLGFVVSLWVGWVTVAVSPAADSTNRSTSTAAVDLGSLSFTNSSGGTFSVDDVSKQLKELQAAVQKTLPMLTAVTESFSNSVDSASAGSLSGIISQVLGSNGQAHEQKGSRQLSNVVAVLEGVLASNTNTNQASSTPVSTAATLRNLAVLQAQLRPVEATLGNIGLPAALTNQTASPTSPSVSGWTRERPLEPTGRD